ncbi:hypothetical protein [Corynebacterium sp. EPI-003-04-2554_SCH2473622]|uniref:hypothetical protein n=1 Tax=Corynebacterium sp. EPI-003-04-2554_SCH2473622 TaxID=1834153 RepID=UPI000A56EA53|nr:hypothetical protein [Corynebacterium sp. EPI-003-04-2554_SCH2473622]
MRFSKSTGLTIPTASAVVDDFNPVSNGYNEGGKATGWKQAINQLAVAYPDRLADYL